MLKLTKMTLVGLLGCSLALSACTSRCSRSGSSSRRRMFSTLRRSRALLLATLCRCADCSTVAACSFRFCFSSARASR